MGIFNFVSNFTPPSHINWIGIHRLRYRKLRWNQLWISGERTIKAYFRCLYVKWHLNCIKAKVGWWWNMLSQRFAHFMPDAPVGNRAPGHTCWRSDTYLGANLPSRGIDENIHTRMSTKVGHNSFFAVDFDNRIMVWNVRLIIQQQGKWQIRSELICLKSSPVLNLPI